MPDEVYVGRVRSLVVLLLLSLLTATLYWFIWFWRINAELYRHEGRTRSPAGRFILFLLVPVLGWFLATWFAGRQLRSLQRRAGVERTNVPLYASIWAGLVPILGWLVAAGSLQAGANRLWLQLADAFDHEAKLERTIQCPACEKPFAEFFNPFMPHSVKCPNCGRAGEI